MATKKATTKKATTTKKEKAVWDEVSSVPSSTPKPAVSDSPDEGVPFGSKSEVEKVIVEYRKHFRSSPAPMNGVATTPEGKQYRYYITDDVFAHADEFVSGKGCSLSQSTTVVDGMNIMHMVIEHIHSGDVRVSSLNLGTPKNLADLGARITYAPKYLVAVLFGISVQTDSDAFGTGVIVNQNETNNSGNSVDVPSSSANTGNSSVGNNRSEHTDSAPAGGGLLYNNRDDSTSEQRTENGSTARGQQSGEVQVEHTPTYEKAFAYIEKAGDKLLLDEGETRVKNSQGLRDDEKEELLLMIADKRVKIA